MHWGPMGRMDVNKSIIWRSFSRQGDTGTGIEVIREAEILDRKLRSEQSQDPPRWGQERVGNSRRENPSPLQIYHSYMASLRSWEGRLAVCRVCINLSTWLIPCSILGWQNPNPPEAHDANTMDQCVVDANRIWIRRAWSVVLVDNDTVLEWSEWGQGHKTPRVDTPRNRLKRPHDG